MLSYNVSGLRDYKKRTSILSRLVFSDPAARPDVLFFQETHSNKHLVKAWEKDFQQYNLFCHHEKGANKSGGLLIAIHKSLDFLTYHHRYCT